MIELVGIFTGFVILGLVLGGLFVWWLARHLYGQQKANLENEVRMLREKHGSQLLMAEKELSIAKEELVRKKRTAGWRAQEGPKGPKEA